MRLQKIFCPKTNNRISQQELDNTKLDHIRCCLRD